LEDDEDVLGSPSFQVLVRDGEALVSGCYFMNPIIQMQAATWDPEQSHRLLVTASDGSRWYADDAPRKGQASVELTELDPAVDRSLSPRSAADPD